MNKLFTKIAGAALGLTMAIGVGVAVGSNVKEASPVIAADGDSPIVLDATSLSLSSTATSGDTNKTYGGVTYVVSTGAKMQSKSGANAFSSNAAILIGKSGTYIYNSTALPGTITKFEVFANGTCSQKVSVGVKFATSKITSWNATGAWTQTLSTQNHVYDASSAIVSGATYFRYQVTNANNSQVQLRITYSSSQKLTVTYDGNGNTGGTVPTDATEYSNGDSVTVKGNTGNLVRTNFTFNGWNTKADGQGTDRAAGSSFNISENTTLYAKWTENDHVSANAASFTVYEGKTLDLRTCVTYGGPSSLSFTFASNSYVSLGNDGYTLNGDLEGGPVTITAHQGSATASFAVTCSPAPSVYTIVPKHNAGSDSSSAFSSFSSTDYEYDTDSITSSDGQKIYNGKNNSIKLGSSSAAGSITIQLKNVVEHITSVVVNAYQYSTDVNKLSVVPTDGEAITADPNTDLGSSAVDYTFEFPDSSYRSFTLTTTSAKRAYVNSISIYYGKMDPVAMTLTAANGKTTITSLSNNLQLTAKGYSDSGKTQEIEGLDFTYSSATESVATVDDNGLVTPVSTGTTVITARYNADLSANITIKVLLVTVDLFNSSSNIELGTEDSFTYSFSDSTIAPSTISTVVWSSSSSSVITVAQNGAFEAKATGNATISVTVTDGDGYVYTNSHIFTVVNTIVVPTHINVQ